jgi:hypothetical protein
VNKFYRSKILLTRENNETEVSFVQKRNKKSLTEKATQTIGTVIIDIAPFASTPTNVSEYKYDLTPKKHQKNEPLPILTVRDQLSTSQSLSELFDIQNPNN